MKRAISCFQFAIIMHFRITGCNLQPANWYLYAVRQLSLFTLGWRGIGVIYGHIIYLLFLVLVCVIIIQHQKTKLRVYGIFHFPRSSHIASYYVYDAFANAQPMRHMRENSRKICARIYAHTRKVRRLFGGGPPQCLHACFNKRACLRTMRLHKCMHSTYTKERVRERNRVRLTNTWRIEQRTKSLTLLCWGRCELGE